MADEKGTQKPKERVKYKFGQNDIDLTNYIHNLGTNVQSYLNSKNWNDGQKQEFMNSYNRYLAGLQEQLANNTNRFTTDDFGSIIDSTGALSNTDNDNIDPVGSEYYYDNKGNRITTDDFNALDKRKQKNYNTFSANREVATYFNTIGNALKDMEPPKEKVQDVFDLSKHGFLADWTTTNNPAGGDFNLNPYLEKDDMDKTTGKRGTSNRAAYLKKQIENYINNLGEYDFSSSSFKTRDAYIQRLQEAAASLENGYNSEDTIALNRAGISGDFLNKFFATRAEEAPIQKSELESQAEQAAQKLAEREKEDQLRAVIKAEADDRYNRERDAFFADYAAQNPFQSREPSTPLPLSYNRNNVVNQITQKYNVDPNNGEVVKEAIRQYINTPELSKLIRGKTKLMSPDKKDITAQHIANNLDLAAQAHLFIDPKYLNEQGKSILPNGYYVLPGSEDYDNWAYIAYNPETRQYQEQSMLLNDEVKKRMAYPEYDKRNKKPNEAQKHQLGGVFKDIESRQNKAQEEKQKVEQKSYTTGRTKEQIESDQAPHTEWSNADRLRLGAIAGDISSLIASMTGVGSVASAGIGMASTAANQAADMAEGMGFLESLGNNAVSYGLDALSLIPFARAAKVPKTIKAIAGFAPKLMAIISTAQGISNAPEITKSLSKLNSSESLTVEDWRNIANGIQIVLGGTAATHRASKAKSHVDAARTNDEWLKTEQGYRRISEQDMKKLREAATIKEQNAILKDYNVTLTESRGRFGLGKGKGKADITSENYFYDFDKPVTTYSGDLPIQHTFGPGEKWLGTRTIPSLRIPAVRNAYNRVIHPQAYGRAKSKVTETPKTNKKSQQPNFDKLRELSSQTGKLTPQEINLINRQRARQKLPALSQQEIDALNVRRARRAYREEENALIEETFHGVFPKKLQSKKLGLSALADNARYMQRGDQRRNRAETQKEVKAAQKELAEANRQKEEITRQQRLGVPTGQGEIVSPDANQARFIMGLSHAIPTVNPSRPPISNPPAIIPKQQVRIEQPQQSLFNYDRIREGLARAEREKLGRDIGEQRLQRAIEANPERSARLQSEEAYRNVRQAFNLYGAPQYKKPLLGAAYKAKQDMYNRLFNQRRYDVIEAFRNRELPHKQSNKKKKTSRDDRRTVKREDGGTLDLVRVRKFQNAGKFPEWYSKLYKFQNLTGWNDQLNQSQAGPSITNSNAGHYKAGDLSEAYAKNNSYTSNPDLVRQDLQSYYDSSFKGKSLDDYVSAYNANAAKIREYWDQERTYKQSGAQEHNKLFKNMFGNRSDNSNNVWNIGYDSNLEDIVGSSTWLRRMDRYEKEFDKLSDEEKKSRIHKIDLGNGNYGYVYKKANGDIEVWNQPVTSPASPASTDPADSQTTSTSVIPQESSNDNKQNKPLFGDINPTILYGLPRAMYADRMNRRMTDLAKESIVPLLKDPFEVHRYTRSDLDAEMQGERNYANLRRLASRSITSDGSLQTATQLQVEVQGQEARTAGKEKSNQVQRQYDELAWQQEKENAANRHETAMFNRERQWVADQIKNKFEQAYLSQKFNIWDVLGQQLEYDARTKQQEKKALADNFAKYDIHNAVNYNPNDYGANLTPNELTVWNKVLSGTNPSSLLPEELNSYKLAAQKVSRVETEQLRQYYKVPNTRWSGKTPSTPWSPTISKAISAKNGAKIVVAGIKAKTADAERFQKQIKECIDRHEKTIDRLSKSLYGLIKASMIK